MQCQEVPVNVEVRHPNSFVHIVHKVLFIHYLSIYYLHTKVVHVMSKHLNVNMILNITEPIQMATSSVFGSSQPKEKKKPLK